MKVLMLGWEFPPYFAGGVGIVCYELTKALNQFDNLQIEYVMAYGPKNDKKVNNLKVTSANQKHLKNITVTEIPTLIYSYDSPNEYQIRYQSQENILKQSLNQKSIKQIYGENIIQEVYLYAKRVAAIYENQNFDIIHAHDWTTIPAALLLKKITKKPIVLHVHITELDKTGGCGGHDKVFEIEKLGFENADKLICVSNFTRLRLINDYNINPNKIEVIHNGGISDLTPTLEKKHNLIQKEKIVLFAGRMTLQKGPEYFLHAAKRVLEYEPNTKFIMAGSGDMLNQIIELSAELGISKNILFHGKYTREEADMFFNAADVFVMPSVSEPFGIVPLEAIAKGTPTIISKQSGISEVLQNCFKIDFWDTEEMAHKILSLIKYKHLNEHMRFLAHHEFKDFSWDKPAKKLIETYKEVNN